MYYIHERLFCAEKKIFEERSKRIAERERRHGRQPPKLEFRSYEPNLSFVEPRSRTVNFARSPPRRELLQPSITQDLIYNPSYNAVERHTPTVGFAKQSERKPLSVQKSVDTVCGMIRMDECVGYSDWVDTERRVFMWRLVWFRLVWFSF